MKKLFAISIITFLFFSCSKNKDADQQQSCNYDSCSVKAPASEIQAVQAYLASNNITAKPHCSGLYYRVESQGTGTVTPTDCSYLTVRYKGMLTNGTVFEENQSAGSNAASAYLDQFILGWRNGLPYIKTGGKIHLYIPPTLAYGAANQTRAGVVIIPGNSVLILEVDMINVQ